MNIEFNADRHTYAINGEPVPNVTSIIRDVIPMFEADPWYLTRGSAVHACAAFMAKGIEFRSPAVIDGQVAGLRKWFDIHKPESLYVETVVGSIRYGFAGTLDYVPRINGKLLLIDWKGTFEPACRLQLGGYYIAAKETLGLDIPKGQVVEVKDNGCKNGEVYDLKRCALEFLNVFSVYNWKQRNGYGKRESRTA